jgi:hypothetical protein
MNSENKEFFILSLNIFIENRYLKCFQQSFTINLEFKDGFIKFCCYPKYMFWGILETCLSGWDESSNR